jgi:outer membrane protein
MRRTAIILALLLSSAAFAADGLPLAPAIEMALNRNEKIAIQEKKVAEARLKVLEKTSAMLPSLGLTASYYRLPYTSAAKAIVLGDSLDDYSLSLALRQPIYSGGKLMIERSIASIALESAENALNKSRNDLRLDVAAAYYRLKHAEEILEAKKTSRDHLKSYLERSKRLYAETRLPRPEDLLQIEVQLGNAEMEAEAAETGLKKYRRGLLDLIRSEEKDIHLSDDLPLPRNSLAYDSISPASNFDYAGAIYELESAREAVDLSKSRLLPALNLNLFTGWEWAQFPPKRDYSNWGFSFEMLLFDFMKTPSGVGQSRRAYEQAALRLEMLRRQISVAQEDLSDSVRSAAARFDMASGNLEKAQRSLELYRKRSLSYTANSKQLLDAEQAALTAGINRLNALLEYNLGLVELNRLNGRADI